MVDILGKVTRGVGCGILGGTGSVQENSADISRTVDYYFENLPSKALVVSWRCFLVSPITCWTLWYFPSDILALPCLV